MLPINHSFKASLVAYLVVLHLESCIIQIYITVCLLLNLIYYYYSFSEISPVIKICF